VVVPQGRLEHDGVEVPVGQREVPVAQPARPQPVQRVGLRAALDGRPQPVEAADDNTIVNVALPTMSRDLGASTQGLQWIVDAYTLVFAGMLLVFGHLGDRHGRRRALQAGGLALMTGGFAVAASTGVTAPYWGKIVIAMTLMAAGLALTASPATEAIMGALPRDQAGAGSAVNDTTRELGGTLGVAIVGSVLSTAYGSHVVTALARLGAPAAAQAAARQSVVAGLAVADRLPPAARAAAAQATRQAFTSGMHAGAWVAAGVTLAAAVATAAFLPARPRAAGAASPAGRADDARAPEAALR
jgi:MFS family permease